MAVVAADERLASEAPSREPRSAGSGEQDLMPSRYSARVRALSMLAFGYVVFAFLHARVLHWFEGPDGAAPLWLSNWTEYAVILAFGIWRTVSERNPYTRKRLAFLTAAVFDYEIKSSYAICVQTSDGNGTYADAFTISVTDVAETGNNYLLWTK